MLSGTFAAALLLGGSIARVGLEANPVMASSGYVLQTFLDGNGTGAWQTIDPDTLVADGLIDCHLAHGTTSGSCAYVYPQGTTVWYKLVPATGSIASESSSGPYQSLILNSVVISQYTSRDGYFALTTETLSLSVTGTGSGTVTTGILHCSSLCPYTAPYGSQIQLTAAADAGSAFAGWSGGTCAGTSATCLFTMTSNVSVGAEFRLIQVQTITFTQPAGGQIGGPPVPLSATSSSGLAVSFTSGSPSICTVSGATAVPVAPGTCSISAHQPGNAFYHAAPDVTRTFSIAPKATAGSTPGATSRLSPSASRGPTATAAVAPSQQPSATDAAAPDASVSAASAGVPEPTLSSAPSAVSTGADQARADPPWLLLIVALLIVVIGTNIAIFQVMKSRRE